MTDIKVLPPKLKIDVNTKIRLRVLAGVLYELTEVCDVHIDKDLQRGVIDRDVIEKITISFEKEEESFGKIYFIINWDKLEILAKSDTLDGVYSGVDFSNGYCNALDKKVLRVLKKHVKELRSKYDIDSVVCSFKYRDKYVKTEEIYNETRKYMNHVWSKSSLRKTDKDFNKSLEVVFKEMDGILDIRFECD